MVNSPYYSNHIYFMRRDYLIAALLVLLVAGLFIYSSAQNDMRKNSDILSGEGMPIKTGEVDYFNNVRGFYAEPTEEGEDPGVVMVHEWWGLNQNIKDMASELAKQGYRVLAVDLFGKVAATPEEARAQVSSLNQEQSINNMKAAAAYLRERGSDSIASLGWCFGGGQSLQLALSCEQFDGTVIY